MTCRQSAPETINPVSLFFANVCLDGTRFDFIFVPRTALRHHYKFELKLKGASMNSTQESIQNVKAILANFENQNGCRVDRLKIHSRTGQTEDFRAIKTFIEMNNIEIDFDDQLPVNQFVFSSKQSDSPELPFANNLIH